MTGKARKSPPKKTASRGVGSLLLWTVIFVLLLVAADQAVLRFSPARPLFKEFQACYQDLRGRLLNQTRHGDPIESLLEPANPSSRSFFYADGHGELHFVDNLQQVPARYRSEAQVLEE